MARIEGNRLVLPGLATAHSHAFQRALRGRTQRRGESFWSWRGLMYDLAERLDPEDVFAITRFAYTELAMAGVCAVGEFHYLHHGRDGTPYDDRLELARAVVRAARDVGIRICLLRVLYHRDGAGRPAEGAQRRFCDDSLDAALADVEALAAEVADDPYVTVGVAPHSVRAVPREWLRDAASFARERALPLHVHVAEQRREVDECVAEHGLRPLQLLEAEGCLDARFVAVHATHLSDDEVRALGGAGALACICRTTERDLGDGAPDVAAMRAAGVRLCAGVDSHAVSDPFEEARAIELDARTRAEARHVAADAPALLEAATRGGYEAIGFPDGYLIDEVGLDPRDPALRGADPEQLEDAVVFAAGPRAVRDVRVGSTTVCRGGMHPFHDEFARAYDEAMARLAEG